MKYADISGLSAVELVKKSKDLRHQIFESSMKNSLGQLANPMTIRHMRRDIARMKTALGTKVAGAAPAAKAAAPKAAAKAPKAAKAKTATKTRATKSAKGE